MLQYSFSHDRLGGGPQSLPEQNNRKPSSKFNYAQSERPFGGHQSVVGGGSHHKHSVISFSKLPSLVMINNSQSGEGTPSQQQVGLLFIVVYHRRKRSKEGLDGFQ